MACGAPVITSNTPAIAEMVGTGARLISPMDYKGLSSNIIRLLFDSNERSALSTAGFTQASKFTWEQTARLTYEVYKEALRIHEQ
jgi:glycosyltransferase involved in cell wall biosynthesis